MHAFSLHLFLFAIPTFFRHNVEGSKWNTLGFRVLGIHIHRLCYLPPVLWWLNISHSSKRHLEWRNGIQYLKEFKLSPISSALISMYLSHVVEMYPSSHPPNHVPVSSSSRSYSLPQCRPASTWPQVIFWRSTSATIFSFQLYFFLSFKQWSHFLSVSNIPRCIYRTKG